MDTPFGCNRNVIMTVAIGNDDRAHTSPGLKEDPRGAFYGV